MQIVTSHWLTSPKWRKLGFYFLRQKYILSERASEEQQTTENRFSMRHVWAGYGASKIFQCAPRIHSFFLENYCSGFFFSFTVLYKISWMFGTINLSLLTKIVWFQIFIFWLDNVNLSSTKKWSRDIFRHHKFFFPGFGAVGNIFFF